VLSELKSLFACRVFYGCSSVENPLRSAAMRGNLRLDQPQNSLTINRIINI
jgi:hypothetical protein